MRPRRVGAPSCLHLPLHPYQEGVPVWEGRWEVLRPPNPEQAAQSPPPPQSSLHPPPPLARARARQNGARVAGLRCGARGWHWPAGRGSLGGPSNPQHLRPEAASLAAAGRQTGERAHARRGLGHLVPPPGAASFFLPSLLPGSVPARQAGCQAPGARWGDTHYQGRKQASKQASPQAAPVLSGLLERGERARNGSRSQPDISSGRAPLDPGLAPSFFFPWEGGSPLLPDPGPTAAPSPNRAR